jgi:hypothetical protein
MQIVASVIVSTVFTQTSCVRAPGYLHVNTKRLSHGAVPVEARQTSTDVLIVGQAQGCTAPSAEPR